MSFDVYKIYNKFDNGNLQIFKLHRPLSISLNFLAPAAVPFFSMPVTTTSRMASHNHITNTLSGVIES